VSAACPVFGFTVALRPTRALDDAHERGLWESFVRETVERRGLVCNDGTHDAKRWSCVVRSEAGQATDADREAIAAWASAQPEIVAVEIGPLVDLTSAD
jgi:uncharacterized protein YggL (DUF469 family)